jgi:hypothetical protein
MEAEVEEPIQLPKMRRSVSPARDVEILLPHMGRVCPSTA